MVSLYKNYTRKQIEQIKLFVEISKRKEKIANENGWYDEQAESVILRTQGEELLRLLGGE